MNKIFILIVLIIAGCNSGTTPSDNTKDPASDSTKKEADSNVAKEDLISGCYQNVLNGDTAFLKMNLHDLIVDGTLNYKRSQKDSNEGTFTGVLKGQIIVIHYKFQSEGTTSIRQIAFMIERDKLVEGYGDILMKGDSAVFENVASLKFQNAQTFNKIACP